LNIDLLPGLAEVIPIIV